MSQSSLAPLIVIAALGAAGWYYREPVMAFLNPPPPAPVSASSQATPHKETVYRWVDKNGVVHYDQDDGAGKRAVEIDQSRIQSLGQTAGASAARQAGNGGVTGATPRTKENLHRAEDRFPQTHQDYTP